MSRFENVSKPGARRSRVEFRARPQLEELESRTVPYVITGNAWPNPQVVSLSFVPDGTILGSTVGGYVYSNLFATFNAKFGSTATWENQILKAAQSWAQQTNLNFTVIPDSGAPVGSGNYQQGDPTMGDIRIGGYNFGSSTLAWGNQPPPVNNYSIAGDVTFNTGQTFNLGTTYDLYTVAAHEIGHALGLGESTFTNAEMFGSYTGAKPSLNSDDIAGIQSIYGGPRADTVSNSTFATATNITSAIDPTADTAVVSNLSLSTTSDVDYYTFTAPANTLLLMTVTVQSSGLSLLAPKVSLYSASQTLLGTVSSTSKVGDTLSLTNLLTLPGEQFYVKVQGTDTTAFSTGAYALTLTFGLNPPPTVPLPNTQVANGNPLQGGGGMAEESDDGTAPAPPAAVLTALPPAAAVANGAAVGLGAAVAGQSSPVVVAGLVPSAAVLPPAGPHDGPRTLPSGPGSSPEGASALPNAADVVPAEAPPAPAPEQAGPSEQAVVPPSSPEAALAEGLRARDAFFAGETRRETDAAVGEFGTREDGLGLGRVLLLSVGGLAAVAVADRTDRAVRSEEMRQEPRRGGIR